MFLPVISKCGVAIPNETAAKFCRVRSRIQNWDTYFDSLPAIRNPARVGVLHYELANNGINTRNLLSQSVRLIIIELHEVFHIYHPKALSTSESATLFFARGTCSISNASNCSIN